MPVHLSANVRRGLRMGLATIAAIAAAGTTGCAGAGPRHADSVPAESASSHAVPAPEPVVPPSGRKFEEPGELDKVLDSKAMPIPPVKPASQASAGISASAKAPEPAKARGSFRIQIGAESDVDAAQAKKAQYEKMLGGTVDMVFDAPYYKLRWGYFETKQDAEDKILELSDQKIQGFVVKQ